MARSGAVECLKLVQRYYGPVRRPTPIAAATPVVSQPRVEDEVSGELDRQAEVQKDDNSSMNVEL